MKAFEYQQFKYFWSCDNWIEWLNMLGVQGWDLVDAVRDYDKRITYCNFKREYER